MAVTALPTPGVTPPNWGQQLNDGIESRYDDLQVLISAGTELASAQVEYSFNTAFAVSPATANAIIGARILVPATTGPVMVEYGCDATVAVSGGGLLQLQLWTDPAFTVPAVASLGVVSAQITSFSGSLLPLRGTYRLGPSTTVRTFFLACQLYRDGGSGLTANTPSTVLSPSFIRAVAL